MLSRLPSQGALSKIWFYNTLHLLHPWSELWTCTSLHLPPSSSYSPIGSPIALLTIHQAASLTWTPAAYPLLFQCIYLTFFDQRDLPSFSSDLASSSLPPFCSTSAISSLSKLIWLSRLQWFLHCLEKLPSLYLNLSLCYSQGEHSLSYWARHWLNFS